MTKEVKKLYNSNDINDTFSYGVVYVYSIPDEKHKGRLKIGGATVNTPQPTPEDINLAAHERIKQQTKTADISYNLEHAELAVKNDGNYFSDYDVHEVLIRSGYKRKAESFKNSHSEWFEVDLDIAKKAIRAVKEGRIALTTKERIISEFSQFSFRPNQRDAINKTNAAIRKKRKHFLWNAKMRFGKTPAAMQVVKENEMKKVLIVTHRPSVNVDWSKDFNKIFWDTKYQYSSRTEGDCISNLIKDKKPFIYFASLQDLRLSKRVVEDVAARTEAEGFAKNEEIFDTTWDMLIIDEAHEGTQSDLGETTLAKIPVKFTLRLSGTPFNILHKHEEEDVYTWDYVMEQEEKINWDERNPGAPNPYVELPSLSIFTYDVDTFESHIGDFGENFHDSLDGAFKFHEFFRVHKDSEGNDTAQFVHKEMIKKFLDLLVDDSLHTKFPYATKEYRNYNKHSLWLLPNRVKIIEAMEGLLKDHPIFGSGQFGIVNISGNNIDDDEDEDAKNRVAKAIKNNEYTITLTGQRLTTGASVPEWTAVFMMSDTSSATTYLQTAFRCQTPAKINGKLKTRGYVFDFEPDRTLKLVAEAIELSHKSGKINSPEQKEAMKQFLNFCPILAAKGGSMKPYDVENMLIQLKKAIIERVSRNGFDDPRLYNDELLKLDGVDITKFNELKKIVGVSKSERINEIEINNLGMNDLKVKQAERIENKKKQKKELTEEEKEVLKKLKEAREQKRAAISILRAVSIRMPMLVYGADIKFKEDITLKKFIDLVDEESWQEFMPEGLTKEKFREFVKYYDEDVFKGVAHSIRAKTYDCDGLMPTERIQAIAEIFSTFKNPDKETVLTPWSAVNMHITKAFGGHDFCSGVKDKVGRPEWKSKDVDTSIWSQDDTKILEINSKSGLYPLLAAYNVYSRRLIKIKKSEEKIYQQTWNKVLAENIFVLCKSPMAKSITQRTLAGYNKGIRMNVVYIKDLIKKLQKKDGFNNYNFREELLLKLNKSDENMKFTAVIGNPPYQEMAGGSSSSDNPIYHLFVDEAYNLSDRVSLITPARFLFNAGKTPKIWNQKMLNNPHLKVLHYEQESSTIFPGTDIMGGVVITYYSKKDNFGSIGIFTASNELKSIMHRVENAKDFKSVISIIETQNKFNLRALYMDFPKYKKIIGSEGSDKRLRQIIMERLNVFTEKPSSKNDYKILGLIQKKRTYRYIPQKYIENNKVINKYKVFVPSANGSGPITGVVPTPLIGEPLIGEPLTGITQTFISFGCFETKNEAEAMLKYVKTKFARTLLGILKITQGNNRETWAKVPLQDFTKKSDIDWFKSISEIDKQLYKKYGLNKKEIDFIENHVKSMA